MLNKTHQLFCTEQIQCQSTSFVYNQLAAYYGINGRYEESISPLTEAIKINPQYTDAYMNRGNSYNALGNFKQSIEDFNRAIFFKPDYADAYYNRGVDYLNHGDNISGCRDARKVCELGNCKLLEVAKGKGDCH